MEYNYGFLFKKSSLPKANLHDLLQLDDFVKILNEFMEQSKEINDATIYDIVTTLYFPMLKDHQTEGFKEQYKLQYGTDAYHKWSFEFRTIGKAARAFSKAMCGSLEKFQNDYLKFCNQ